MCSKPLYLIPIVRYWFFERVIICTALKYNQYLVLSVVRGTIPPAMQAIYTYNRPAISRVTRGRRCPSCRQLPSASRYSCRPHPVILFASRPSATAFQKYIITIYARLYTIIACIALCEVVAHIVVGCRKHPPPPVILSQTQREKTTQVWCW